MPSTTDISGAVVCYPSSPGPFATRLVGLPANCNPGLSCIDFEELPPHILSNTAICGVEDLPPPSNGSLNEHKLVICLEDCLRSVPVELPPQILSDTASCGAEELPPPSNSSLIEDNLMSKSSVPDEACVHHTPLVAGRVSRLLIRPVTNFEPNSHKVADLGPSGIQIVKKLTF